MGFRVIVAGGREFNNYYALEAKLLYYLKNKMPDVEIVCGLAKGADNLGKVFGIRHKLKVNEFPADWDKHGKSAGYLRNSEMADNADALVAFWDGKSKGTGHMISLAKQKGILVKIIYYKVVQVNKYSYVCTIINKNGE